MKKKTPAADAAAAKLSYLTGAPVDSTLWKSALIFLGSLLLVAVLYLLVGGMGASLGNWVGTVISGGLLVVTWLIFLSTGQSNGASAVNQGEIMYRRLETNREVTPEERARCYHPLKGWIIALVGSLPVLILTVVFACITRRTMSSPGALPSWVSQLSSRPDLLKPLASYTQYAGLSLEDGLRIPVRILLLPWSGLLGISDPDRFLVLERLAPLLTLIPAFCYGLGYFLGTRVRAQVHMDIAAGKRRREKKERQARKRRTAPGHNGPQQLN